LKWVAGVLAAIAIVGALAAPKKSDDLETPAATAASELDRGLDPVVPDRQKSFVALTADFERRFNSSANELQQNALRDERRTALLAVLPELSVTGWIGKITKLETNSEGRALVSVRVSPNTSLTTWNNALSDLGSNTLIEKDSQLYGVLMNLKIGDEVKLSGRLFPSETDGFHETSVTIRGSMTDPEYLFDFHSVAKK